VPGGKGIVEAASDAATIKRIFGDDIGAVNVLGMSALCRLADILGFGSEVR
jgi:hypothetical protein